MELHFKEPPRIGHRDDAIDLLQQLLEAESVMGLEIALEALLDAVQRGIV